MKRVQRLLLCLVIGSAIVVSIACVKRYEMNLHQFDPDGSLPTKYRTDGQFLSAPSSGRAQLVEFDKPDESMISYPDTALRKFFRNHNDDFKSYQQADPNNAYLRALRTVLPAIVHRIRNREFVTTWLDAILRCNDLESERPSDLKSSQANKPVCAVEQAFASPRTRRNFVDALSQYLEYRHYTTTRLAAPEILIDEFRSAIEESSQGGDVDPNIPTRLPFLTKRVNLKPDGDGNCGQSTKCPSELLWDTLRVQLRNRAYLHGAINEALNHRSYLMDPNADSAFRNELFQEFRDSPDVMVNEELDLEADYDYWWLTFFPKFTPPSQGYEATSTITVNFERRLVPDDQYRRWLLDSEPDPRVRLLRAIDDLLYTEQFRDKPESQFTEAMQSLRRRIDAVGCEANNPRSQPCDFSERVREELRAFGTRTAIKLVAAAARSSKSAGSNEKPKLQLLRFQAPVDPNAKQNKPDESKQVAIKPDGECNCDLFKPSMSDRLASLSHEMMTISDTGEISSVQQPAAGAESELPAGDETSEVSQEPPLSSESKGTDDSRLKWRKLPPAGENTERVLVATEVCRAVCTNESLADGLFRQALEPKRDPGDFRWQVWTYPDTRVGLAVLLLRDVLEMRAATPERAHFFVRALAASRIETIARSAANNDPNSSRTLERGCKFLEQLDSIADAEFVSFYPDVPSPEEIRDKVMRTAQATESLASVFFRAELKEFYQVFGEVRCEDSDDSERCKAVRDCLGTVSSLDELAIRKIGSGSEKGQTCERIIGPGKIARFKTLLVDVFARFPELNEEVREQVELGIIRLATSRSSDSEEHLMSGFLASFLRNPSAHEALRGSILDAVFRGLESGLYRISDVNPLLQRHLGDRDPDPESVAARYATFQTTGRVHPQEGLQVVEMLPLSKDETVAQAVSEGGVLTSFNAAAVAAASGSARYERSSSRRRTNRSGSPAVLEGTKTETFSVQTGVDAFSVQTSKDDENPVTVSFKQSTPAEATFLGGPYDIPEKTTFSVGIGTRPRFSVDVNRGAPARAAIRIGNPQGKSLPDGSKLTLRVCAGAEACTSTSRAELQVILKTVQRVDTKQFDLALLEGRIKELSAASGGGLRVKLFDDAVQIETSEATAHAWIEIESSPEAAEHLAFPTARVLGKDPFSDRTRATTDEVRNVLASQLKDYLEVTTDNGNVVIRSKASGPAAVFSILHPESGSSALPALGLAPGYYHGKGHFRDPGHATAAEVGRAIDPQIKGKKLHAFEEEGRVAIMTDAIGPDAYVRLVASDKTIVDALGLPVDKEANGSSENTLSPGVTQFLEKIEAGSTSLKAQIDASVNAAFHAKASRAYAYSQSKDYLNAVVTAAGRGGTWARWILWPGPTASVGGDKQVYQGYPNGDQPFNLLLKVPRKAIHKAWDGRSYIYFNSAYGIDHSKQSTYLVRYPFMYDFVGQQGQVQARMPNYLGARLYLDTTDKIPYSTIKAMVSAEKAFIETTRSVQKAHLGTLIKEEQEAAQSLAANP